MAIYTCKLCGHVAFDKVDGPCPVCGAPETSFVQNDNLFKESEEKSPEASVKHVPSLLVQETCGLIPEDACLDVHVRVGETLHPMTAEHYIHFVDCYVDKQYMGRAQFRPNGINPAAAFHLKKQTGEITIVANCNIHGYWFTSVTR